MDIDFISPIDDFMNTPQEFNTAFQGVSKTIANPTSFKEKVQPFMVFLNVLSILFLAVIAYSFIRLLEIRRKEKQHLKHEIEEYAYHQREREKKSWDRESGPKNEKWESVLEHLFSPNSSDWKLAIMEADVILDGLMNYLGVPGEDLGEKLKNANKEKFHNIASAWEVHIIRNKIAHEGSDFELSQYEAKRIIALYEQIFREFGYLEI